MIRNSGVEPEVIEYLKTPPSKERLAELIAAMGAPGREVLRRKGTRYDKLGLDEPKWAAEQLLELMVHQPILISRPIVIMTLGTRLCRPSELALDILPLPQQNAFSKEDGELVTDAHGRRITKARVPA